MCSCVGDYLPCADIDPQCEKAQVTADQQRSTGEDTMMNSSTGPGAPMIETEDLRRTFKVRKGTVEAVRGVDLRVEAGEIFGFLGPNGAGKTTTLRMLATLLKPTSGSATCRRAARRTRPRPAAASS
jgi:ABC-type glutathione transport system ATPase component